MSNSASILARFSLVSRIAEKGAKKPSAFFLFSSHLSLLSKREMRKEKGDGSAQRFSKSTLLSPTLKKTEQQKSQL
jgi:hypothetical protein